MTRARNLADQINRINSSAADATALTIDSSENVLVAKTSSNGTTVGGEIRATGLGLFTASGTNSLQVRRLSNDGDLVEFYKDTGKVGSIGSVASGANLYMSANSGVGLGIGGDNLYPVNAAGASTDGALDIGDASARFKDFYLSGGVFLGGTGSANKLDDYEEGTWTPSFDGLTNTPTYSNLFGRYTKMGRAVTVQLFMQNSSTLPTFSSDTDQLKITGLPFTVSGIGYTGSSGVVLAQAFRFDGTHNNAGVTGQVGSGVNSSEQMQFYVTVSGGTRGIVRNSSVTAGFIIEATVTYFVSD